MNNLSLSLEKIEELLNLTQEEFIYHITKTFNNTNKKYNIKYKSKKEEKEALDLFLNDIYEEIEKYNMLKSYSVKVKNGYMLVNK